MRKKYLNSFRSSLLFLLLASLLVVSQPSCTVVPKHVIDSGASFDSSTPKTYPVSRNGGFLEWTKTGAIITDNARERYNNLIDIYGNRFYQIKAVRLRKDDGVTPFLDVSGNNVWEIDNQHLTYFAIMNSWKKSNIAP